MNLVLRRYAWCYQITWLFPGRLYGFTVCNSRDVDGCSLGTGVHRTDQELINLQLLSQNGSTRVNRLS